MSTEEWAVRRMYAADIAEIVALAREQPAAPHWPEHEYLRMLQVIAEAPARRGAWVLSPREGSAPAAAAGYCMASQAAGVCELEAVVVRADLRGSRLGEKLTNAVVGWCRETGAERLQLEARASNAPALRLYARMGFSVDGRRRSYYRNPEEDAVLMSMAIEA